MSTFHALLVAEASLAASANRHPSPMCVSEAPGRCDSYRRSPVLLQCQDRDEVVVAERAGYGERIVVKVMPARGQRCPARKSYLEGQGKRARCDSRSSARMASRWSRNGWARSGSGHLASPSSPGEVGPPAAAAVRRQACRSEIDGSCRPLPVRHAPSRCRKALNDPASAAPAWLRRAPRQRRR